MDSGIKWPSRETIKPNRFWHELNFDVEWFHINHSLHEDFSRLLKPNLFKKLLLSNLILHSLQLIKKTLGIVS